MIQTTKNIFIYDAKKTKGTIILSMLVEKIAALDKIGENHVIPIILKGAV